VGDLQPYDHGDPTSAEQLMLELINRARANPDAEAARFGIDLNEGLAPGTLSPTPKQPLAFNSHLITAARGHSLWMLDNDTFSHFETGGINPGDRMGTAGYVFSGSWTFGENLAYRGTTPGFPPLAPTVALEHDDLFVDAGIDGRGHRLNLMQDNYREIGVGAVTGVFTAQGNDFNAVMTTQDFGATGANPGPFLVGVVYRDLDGDGFYSPGEGVAGVSVKPVGGTFFAVTSTSGGYAIPIRNAASPLSVSISGSGISGSVTKSIPLTGKNVKLDFELNSATAAVFGFVPGSARRSPSGQFEADVSGPANARVAIEVSENLASWSQIGEVTLTSVGAHFSDAQAVGRAARFYRAVKR
jgi:hypothetical protein